MTTADFLQMSPLGLKELATKTENLIIRWKPEPASEHRIILDNYPKRVGIVFSGYIKKEFPDSSPTVFNSVRLQKSTITLVGGDVDALRRILRWTTACCQGKGRVPYPFAQKDNAYTQTCLDREAAQVFQIPWLVDELVKHMQKLESRTLQPNDIRALLTKLEYPHEIFYRVVAHVADKTWEDMQKRRAQRQLKKDANGKLLPRERLPSDRFVPVRKEFPFTLGKDVDTIIEERLQQARSPLRPRQPSTPTKPALANPYLPRKQQSIDRRRTADASEQGKNDRADKDIDYKHSAERWPSLPVMKASIRVTPSPQARAISPSTKINWADDINDDLEDSFERLGNLGSIGREATTSHDLDTSTTCKGSTPPVVVAGKAATSKADTGAYQNAVSGTVISEVPSIVVRPVFIASEDKSTGVGADAATSIEIKHKQAQGPIQKRGKKQKWTKLELSEPAKAQSEVEQRAVGTMVQDLPEHGDHGRHEVSAQSISAQEASQRYPPESRASKNRDWRSNKSLSAAGISESEAVPHAFLNRTAGPRVPPKSRGATSKDWRRNGPLPEHLVSRPTSFIYASRGRLSTGSVQANKRGATNSNWRAPPQASGITPDLRKSSAHGLRNPDILHRSPARIPQQSRTDSGKPERGANIARIEAASASQKQKRTAWVDNTSNTSNRNYEHSGYFGSNPYAALDQS